MKTLIDIQPCHSDLRRRWQVLSLKYGVMLGKIIWASQQKQFVFITRPNSSFRDSCLNEIARFIKQQNEEVSREQM